MLLKRIWILKIAVPIPVTPYFALTSGGAHAESAALVVRCPAGVTQGIQILGRDTGSFPAEMRLRGVPGEWAPLEATPRKSVMLFYQRRRSVHITVLLVDRACAPCLRPDTG
jgi:hypothetical protein